MVTIEQYILPYVQDELTYNAVVEEIDYSNSQVKVTTKDGMTYSADKAIVAVPLSVLRQGDITFILKLPAATSNALQEVTMEAGLNVFIEFQEKFYTDLTFDVSCLEMMREGEWDLKLFFDGVFGKDQSNTNVLTFFCVGEPSESLVDKDEDTLIESILNQLDELYDGKARQHYVKHVVQNWSKEPFIRGSYAFGAVQPLAPVERKLFFAGDYLSQDWTSTIHGAAMIGRSAAVAAVKSKKEQL